MRRFDPERLLSVLAEHDVSFVLIGGLAAVAHGSPLPTTDVDIAPDRGDENLGRLATALSELGARIRTAEPDGVVFRITSEFLAAQPHILNLVTDAGDLDLTFAPAGFPSGYVQLVDRSVPLVLVADVTTQVATLDAIIESKEAAGREKDRRALPYLYALADQIAGP